MNEQEDGMTLANREPINKEVFEDIRSQSLTKDFDLATVTNTAMLVATAGTVVDGLKRMRDLIGGDSDNPFAMPVELALTVLGLAVNSAVEVLDAVLLVDHEKMALKHSEPPEGKC